MIITPSWSTLPATQHRASKVTVWASRSSIVVFSTVKISYLSFSFPIRHFLITGITSHASLLGGGPRVVVSTAAFHARVRGSVPGLGGLKGTKMFLPHPRVKVSIVWSLRDREVACSASDRQGSNFESCVWRTVSSQSSHHPQEVLLAQFSLYVHKGGLKPDSFHFFLLPSYCEILKNATKKTIKLSEYQNRLHMPTIWFRKVISSILLTQQ